MQGRVVAVDTDAKQLRVATAAGELEAHEGAVVVPYTVLVLATGRAYSQSGIFPNTPTIAARAAEVQVRCESPDGGRESKERQMQVEGQ